MPDRAPGDMRNAAAGKMGARPDAAMKSISEQLRSKFANVLTEPLPKSIVDVMAELDWGRGGGSPTRTNRRNPASAKSRRP
ncbi:hypothetical protein F7D13_16045 [Methylocystis rosea]|uniref:Anti-sigma factor NepR domain-containing protein n=1 Tax=Methylocystis rosea TaxID=173366 RepID=A0ABX6EKV3_9HYPH|nr:hypothetical protein F7D13_16045 [Methylocystis rosea]